MTFAFRRLLWMACSSVVFLAGCGGDPAAPTEAGTKSAGETSDGGSDGAGAGGGGPPGAARCDALARSLQEALDASAAAQSLPGVAAAVDVDGCKWRGASGLSDVVAKSPMPPRALFRVGSITKTFIATLV